MAVVRALVGNPNGTIIGELDLAIRAIPWWLNNVGKSEISIARTDVKATGDYLGFGNRVLFQFDNGLPDWGGVIDPPRKWAADRIKCPVYSGERLLLQRVTGKDRSFSTATAGYVYQHLIEDANVMADTGISIGDIWTGGDTHSPRYHYDEVLEQIQRQLTVRLSAADFAIVASESEGRIVFTAHFYERRGMNKPGVVLLQGHNVSKVELVERGPIVNAWYIVGAGSTWGDERLVGYAEDVDSIADYGLRQGCELHTDIAAQASSLNAIAANRMRETAQPYNVLSLTAANLAPAEFADYEVGDSVRVMLHDYGFDGYDHMVRVHSRVYDPATGACKLVGREES